MTQNNETYSDYIRDLTYDSLTGNINPEDAAKLKSELLENPEAKIAWRKAMDAYEQADVQHFLKENATHTLFFKSEKKKRKIRPLLIWIAAASLLIAIPIAWKLYTNSNAPVTALAITLKTGDGKSITLGGATKTINTSAATLFNQDNALTYDAAASEASSGTNTLTVPPGMGFRINLSDGTKVWLNSATTLNFPFKFGDKREISIDGEAYLEVAPDSHKPFIVHLPEGKTIEVLGTGFNVNTYEREKALVSLVSGAVKVNSAGKSLLLKPGVQAVVKGTELDATVFNEENVLSWREGKYYFRMATLKDISKVLSRWYGKQVIIDSKETEMIPFTGNLNRSDSIGVFLERAKMVIGIEYYYGEDKSLHIK